MLPADPAQRFRLSPKALLTTALALACTALATDAQERAAKPDQVFARHRRTGVTATLSGTVKSNKLDEVVLETRDGEESKIETSLVQRIVFGDVPVAFVDAETYADRGDFEDAVVQYRLAVDGSSRGVVRAEARLRAAEALLSLGAQDPVRLDSAIEEVRRFLTDYSDNRSVPRARLLEAKALYLKGSTAEAAAIYREIYEAGAGPSPTPGYSPSTAYRAGELAAEAFLAAGDVASARAVGSAMTSTLPGVIASLDDDDPNLADLQRSSSHATLIEGYALLAEDSAARARTFFDSHITDDAPAALAFGARLGRARALLEEGQARDAQLEFGLVAAADYTDENRTAAALLGLARATAQLPDSGAPVQIRRWLETIRERYGETPSGPAARAMLASL